MSQKARVRTRVLALLDELRRAGGLSERGAAIEAGLDPSAAQKLRTGERISIGLVQQERIAKKLGLRMEYFTSPDSVSYRSFVGDRLVREDVPQALEDYFAERASSGRPVRDRVADRARASARSTGMATRTEAAALVDFLEGVVAREERGEPAPAADARSVVDEAAGQRAVVRQPRKR